MTAILPRPAELVVSDVGQLRRENTNLRAMVTALLAELVRHDMCAARNYAEHPRTEAQLAEIAADAWRRYELIALHAIPAAEENRK